MIVDLPDEVIESLSIELLNRKLFLKCEIDREERVLRSSESDILERKEWLKRNKDGLRIIEAALAAMGTQSQEL